MIMLLAALIGVSTAAAADPYAPLTLYDGAWTAVASGGEVTPLENHCARTGRFFACEQVVRGKTMALVVFLPAGSSELGQSYLTQALTTGGERPGPWHRLLIEGDRWTYGDITPPGAKASRERTVNQFFGPNHIHYKVQTSRDGRAWVTTASGDERRSP